MSVQPPVWAMTCSEKIGLRPGRRSRPQRRRVRGHGRSGDGGEPRVRVGHPAYELSRDHPGVRRRACKSPEKGLSGKTRRPCHRQGVVQRFLEKGSALECRRITGKDSSGWDDFQEHISSSESCRSRGRCSSGNGGPQEILDGPLPEAPRPWTILSFQFPEDFGKKTAFPG
ncbi:MAG: hypothetical protein MZV70_73250 [Desulfobacterales bacterium]|nr:hypothetical protein [Desulfobacterales bacterium]